MANTEKVTFTVKIGAHAAKVWNTLWDKESYREWTKVFTEGSYYEGEISEGARIHFLTPNGSGMYSEIEKLAVNELLVFRHLGEIKEFKELPPNEKTLEWAGGREIYRLSSEDENTILELELDTSEEFKKIFDETFPKALDWVKKICTD